MGGGGEDERTRKLDEESANTHVYYTQSVSGKSAHKYNKLK